MKIHHLVFLSLLWTAVTGYADIDNIAFLGHNEQNPAHIMDAEIVGDRAYIANGLGSGLEVYDISDPAGPVRVYAGGPAAWRCRAYGDTILFVFSRRSGVTIWDISGTGTPVMLGQYDPVGAFEALEGGALVSDTLYCAAHQNGIYAVDISTLSSPNKVAEFRPDSAAFWNVEAQDSFLYAANGRFGFEIIGLEGGLHAVARLDLPGCANDIVLDGQVAVLSLGVDGIATVDISDPYNPQLLDIIPTAGCAWGSGITGHLVVAGAWRVMEVFDVTAPDSIVRLGWDNTKTWAHGADIRDDSLIAVADWRGMSCYHVGEDQDADIDIYPQIIDFGPVDTQRDTVVVVRNTGSSILSVTSVSTPSDIAADPNIFSVAAGDSQFVTITAAGSDAVYGHVTYYSNDPDEPDKQQEVYKNNTSFPQAGSQAPDFTLLGSDGNNHTLSDYQGKVVFLEFGGAW